MNIGKPVREIDEPERQQEVPEPVVEPAPSQPAEPVPA